MEEQKVEQFWRDADGADVMRVMDGQGVQARFRDRTDRSWKHGLLSGWSKIDKPDDLQWASSEGTFWRFCQVYDPPEWYVNKPEPGEGWRLLEKFPPEPKLGTDEVWRLFKTWETTANDNGVQEEDCWYRRRIETKPTQCAERVCGLAESTGVTCPHDSCDLETGVREASNTEISNESSELVAIAMQMACEEFGRGDGVFNSANFEHACRKIAGSSCSLDGHVIAFILDGRKDVEVLKGGRHYRYLKYASRNCSAQEQQSNNPEIPDSCNSSEISNSCRSSDTIPSGWRVLGEGEERLASDAYWSLGCKEWLLIGDDRVEYANELPKWHAIRQVVVADFFLLEGYDYSMPGGQTIRITAKGFEVV